MGWAKEVLRPYVWAARNARKGNLSIADLAWGSVRSFSQFGEDVALERLFRDKQDGFYVDVGAFDPFVASNTCLLYRRGWRGINIEPDPTGQARLRRHRPRDVTVGCAVGTESGTASFIRDGLLAGLDRPGRLWADDPVNGAQPRKRLDVEVRPLSSILAEHLPPGQHIDLMDVDCEGHDLDVLESNDWIKHRPSVVLAECHPERSDVIESYLTELGYRLGERLPPSALFIDTKGPLG